VKARNVCEVGNSAGTSSTDLFPQQIADQYYAFPLSGALFNSVATGNIGLVEPGIGTAVSAGSPSFESLLNLYRAATEHRDASHRVHNCWRRARRVQSGGRAVA
jgi:hypothetical protein